MIEIIYLILMTAFSAAFAIKKLSSICHQLPFPGTYHSRMNLIAGCVELPIEGSEYISADQLRYHKLSLQKRGGPYIVLYIGRNYTTQTKVKY